MKNTKQQNNHIKNSLYVLLIIVISACNGLFSKNEDDLIIANTELNPQLELSRKISIRDTVYFQQFLPKYSYQKMASGEELIALTPNPSQIVLYDLTNERLLKVIDPNKDRRIISNIGKVYFHAYDSLFIFRNQQPKAFLINFEGELLNRWELSDAPINWGERKDYTLKNSTSLGESFILHDNKFFISLNVSSFFKIKSEERGTLKSEAIYDIQLDQWDKLYGKWPDYYLQGDQYQYEPSFTQPSIFQAENKIFMTYPQSHNIYMYDLQGNLLKAPEVKSEYIDAFNSPLTFRQNEDDLARLTYDISSPKYLGFHYHSDLKLFSRIVRHKFDMIKADGKFRNPCEMVYSIIYMDSQMQKIDEQVLDGTKYEWKSALATPNGFWLMPICEDKLTDEDIMAYTDHMQIKLK